MTLINPVTSLYKFNPMISKEQAIDDFDALSRIKRTAQDAIGATRTILTVPGLRKDEILNLVKTVDYHVDSISKMDNELAKLKHHIAGSIFEQI